MATPLSPLEPRGVVLGALRQLVDPAFLPRAIHFVPRLPRNETGKLPRADLMALLRARQTEK